MSFNKEQRDFSGQYLRNRSTLDIGVLGYIGILYIRNTLPKSGTFLLGHPVYIGLKEKRGYWKSKEESLDRNLWRTRFGRGYGPVVKPTT
jgi:hypothetical protein